MSKILAGLILFLSFAEFAHSQMAETIEQRRHDYLNLRQSKFGLLPHRPMYLMPFVHNWVPHEDVYKEVKPADNNRGGDYYNENEAEFQISFAIPLVKDIGERKWDFMFSYTHHAYWQVYNSDWSRPFRETSYMPELFSRYVYSGPKDILGFKLHALDMGYVHQSNGQVQQLSRSWDRLFARVYLDGPVSIFFTGWYRLNERSETDDNPDIHNYLGFGEIEISKKFESHLVQFKVPFLAAHPSYDLKYSHPLHEGIRWFVNFQSGYGHSMIEYNRFTQRLGVGFMLENFLY
jgi:phospholipase A1